MKIRRRALHVEQQRLDHGPIMQRGHETRRGGPRGSLKFAAW
jgi:hypothetical protein